MCRAEVFFSILWVRGEAVSIEWCVAEGWKPGAGSRITQEIKKGSTARMLADFPPMPSRL